MVAGDQLIFVPKGVPTHHTVLFLKHNAQADICADGFSGYIVQPDVMSFSFSLLSLMPLLLVRK